MQKCEPLKLGQAAAGEGATRGTEQGMHTGTANTPMIKEIKNINKFVHRGAITAVKSCGGSPLGTSDDAKCLEVMK